ncbi:MAG TPA: response regulator [Hypericibacter adhaerens]|uniref:response regulator n=1 Tax=Hypericibacter adhaerens TaxID=2602016 RepID=UPI002CE51D9D|nr:response regulator [Hypericibacter adhaerens]HWA46235.1 response regulator [Hypericibacter adhaerens]
MSRVLVLDDEPLIAMMIEDWLTELGHAVVGPAHNLAAAMTLVEAGGIDAAFLDLTLGDGNSYGVAQALDERSVPFAFITGHGGAVQAQFAKAPVLAKPFDFEAVRQTMAKLADR